MSYLIYIILFLLVCIGIYLTRRANHKQKFAEYNSARINQYELLLQYTKETYKNYMNDYNTQKQILPQIYKLDKDGNVDPNCLLYINKDFETQLSTYIDKFKNILDTKLNSPITLDNIDDIQNSIQTFLTDTKDIRNTFNQYYLNYEKLLTILVKYGGFNDSVQSILEYIDLNRAPNVVDINFSSVNFITAGNSEELCRLNDPLQTTNTLIIQVKEGTKVPIVFMNTKYIPYYLDIGLHITDTTRNVHLSEYKSLNILPYFYFEQIDDDNYYIYYKLNQDQLKTETNKDIDKYYLYYDGSSFVFDQTNKTPFQFYKGDCNTNDICEYKLKFNNDQFINPVESIINNVVQPPTQIEKNDTDYNVLFVYDPLNFNLDVTSIIVNYYCKQVHHLEKCDLINYTINHTYPEVGKCMFMGSKCNGIDMVQIDENPPFNFCDDYDETKHTPPPVTYDRIEQITNHTALCDVLKSGVNIDQFGNVDDPYNAFSTHCYNMKDSFFNDDVNTEYYVSTSTNPPNIYLGDNGQDISCRLNEFEYVTDTNINNTYKYTTNLYGDKWLITNNYNNVNESSIISANNNCLHDRNNPCKSHIQNGYYKLNNPKNEMQYYINRDPNEKICKNNYKEKVCQSLNSRTYNLTNATILAENPSLKWGNLNDVINITQTSDVDSNILNIPQRGFKPYLKRQDILSRIHIPFTKFVKNGIASDIKLYDTSNWYPYIDKYVSSEKEPFANEYPCIESVKSTTSTLTPPKYQSYCGPGFYWDISNSSCSDEQNECVKRCDPKGSWAGDCDHPCSKDCPVCPACQGDNDDRKEKWFSCGNCCKSNKQSITYSNLTTGYIMNKTSNGDYECVKDTDQNACKTCFTPMPKTITNISWTSLPQTDSQFKIKYDAQNIRAPTQDVTRIAISPNLYPNPIENKSLSDMVNKHSIYLGDHYVDDTQVTPRWDIPRQYICENNANCFPFFSHWDNTNQSVWKGAPVAASNHNDFCNLSETPCIPGLSCSNTKNIGKNCDGYLYDNEVEIAEKTLYDLLKYEPKEIPNINRKHLIIDELKIHNKFLKDHPSVNSIIINIKSDDFKETKVDLLFKLNMYQLFAFIIIPIFILCFKMYPLKNSKLVNITIRCIYASMCILLILLIANFSNVFYKKTTYINRLANTINKNQEQLTKLIDATDRYKLLYNNIRMYMMELYDAKTNTFNNFKQLMYIKDNTANNSIFYLDKILKDIQIAKSYQTNSQIQTSLLHSINNNRLNYLDNFNKYTKETLYNNCNFYIQFNRSITGAEFTEEILQSYSRNLLIDNIFNTLQLLIGDQYVIKPVNYDTLTILQSIQLFEYIYYKNQNICQLDKNTFPNVYVSQRELLDYKINTKRVNGDRIPKLYCYGPINDELLEPFKDYKDLKDIDFSKIPNKKNPVTFYNYLKLKQLHTYNLAQEHYLGEEYDLEMKNLLSSEGTYCMCKYKETSDPLSMDMCNGWIDQQISYRSGDHSPLFYN